jgi:hypothetical protein
MPWLKCCRVYKTPGIDQRVSVPQTAEVPVSLTIRGQPVRWEPHTLNISELRLVDPNVMRGKQLAEFLTDVKANGIRDALKYVTIGGEKYVVQGSNRLRAAILPEVNIPTVPGVEVTLPFRGYRTAEEVLIDNATARWGFGKNYKR